MSITLAGIKVCNVENKKILLSNFLTEILCVYMMKIMSFDKEKNIQTLTESGIQEKQAQGIVAPVDQFIEDNFVTRNDLDYYNLEKLFHIL